MDTDTTTDAADAPAVPALAARGLTKRYRGRAVVDGIDVVVGQGECVGLLGGNGAGKTTTVELLAGLRRPDAGEARVLGLDPRRDRARVRAVLGMQLQEAELHWSLRVDELLALHRSFHASPRSTGSLLELVDLVEHRRTRFDRLSGGQQQRLSIALALIGRPRVVILDELTTGLDPRARRRMWATVEQLRAEGVAVLLVSHAMEEVERLCDRVVILDRGRVVAEGTPAAVVAVAGVAGLDEAFLALTGSSADDLEAAA